MSGLLLEAVPDITAHITNQLTFQVRRATIVAREIIRVVRSRGVFRGGAQGARAPPSVGHAQNQIQPKL